MGPAGVTLPRVMSNRDVDMHDFPDHANVLAVVSAYTDAQGAMPYALLRDAMASLDAIHDEMAISSSGSIGVAMALHNVVTDLRHLDLIDLGPAGTVVTSCGEDRLKAWNGKFRERRSHATRVLQELQFLPN